MPVEEAWTAAFAQARLQKIYFPGEQFTFSFRMKSSDGGRSTPAVHNLDLALQFRKQFLGSKDGSMESVIEMQSRMKEVANAMKVDWQTRTRKTQKQLEGYISGKLQQQKDATKLDGERCRGKWKQSVMSNYENMTALPWLTELLVDETDTTQDKESVQESLRSFLNSGGRASLRNLLHSAVQEHQVARQLALGDDLPCVLPGNSERKRRSTASSSSRPAKAAKQCQVLALEDGGVGEE